MSSNECDHSDWSGKKCPRCNKELTWKERWNITVRNLDRLKKSDIDNKNQGFIEYAEIKLKELGEEYVE